MCHSCPRPSQPDDTAYVKAVEKRLQSLPMDELSQAERRAKYAAVARRSQSEESKPPAGWDRIG